MFYDEGMGRKAAASEASGRLLITYLCNASPESLRGHGLSGDTAIMLLITSESPVYLNCKPFPCS